MSCLRRVVRRSHLRHHLVFIAQVDPLGQLAPGHAPEVQVVSRHEWPLRTLVTRLPRSR